MKNPWLIGLVALIAIVIVYFLMGSKKETGTGTTGTGTTGTASTGTSSGNARMGGTIQCECANGKICFSGKGTGCDCCGTLVNNVAGISSVSAPITRTRSFY